MNDHLIGKILKELMPKLDKINFAVLGTLNLYFQGIDVAPRDIDFLTNNKGIEKISSIFDCSVTKKEGYLETKFEVDGIEIHFVSNESNPIRPLNFMKYVLAIEKYGIKIPCMSLKSELTAYREMERDKDKEKIKALEEKLDLTNRF